MYKIGFKKIITISSIFVIALVMFVSTFSMSANDEKDDGWYATNDVPVVEQYNEFNL